MNATNIERPFGFLTWWTIHQGVYEISTLRKVSQQAGLPLLIDKLIVGMDEKAAWLKSTQLGAVGKEAPTTEEGLTGKFFTKELGEEMRAITYEVVDRNKKKVFARQVATLGRDGGNILADVEPWTLDDQGLVTNLMDLIYTMQDGLDQRVGKMDDSRVRNLILDWLVAKHRVSVRGAGGVYFIPGINQDLQTEILAVRNWIIETGAGTFSTVSLRDDGATSMADFQQSAVEEIMAEIKEISTTLDKYENSETLQEGRLAYLTGNQLAKINTLEEKIRVLNDTLGDIQDRVNAEFIVVATAARKLIKTVQVNQTPVAKAASKNADNQSGKKSGTVQDRKKKKEIV